MIAVGLFVLVAVTVGGAENSNRQRTPLCSIIWRPWVREDFSGYVIIEARTDTIPATVWRAPYRLLGAPPDTATRPIPGVVIYGQHTRIVRTVGLRDSTFAVPADAVLVEWSVDSMCSPIPPARPHRALSLRAGTAALLVTAPRTDTIAPAGFVVLNLHVATRFYAPAAERETLPRSWRRLWRRPRVLTIEEYESLFRSLSTYAEWEHAPAKALETLDTWARAHPDLARRYPARGIIHGAREEVERRASQSEVRFGTASRVTTTRALPTSSASLP